jgi:hypothetical protein
MKTRDVLMLLLLGTAGLVGGTPSAWARHASDWVDIEIIDDRGRVLPQFPVERGDRRDTRRAYVEARRGRNYSVRVSNHSRERVGLVIAVDGRNIISGAKSHLAPREQMYVLNPRDSAVYEGWRTARDRVNRFYFTDAADSYADAFGDRSAMGVIAVAVFRERARYGLPLKEQEYSGPGGRPDPTRRSLTAREPGTGFGESEWSPARRVEFEPDERPVARHFLKYEWRESLCRKGVIECRRPDPRPRNRFWPDHPEPDGGFAPYPPGYRY